MMGGGENDLFPGGIEANFVRVIWQQMLKAVNAMHEQRVRILRGVEGAVFIFNHRSVAFFSKFDLKLRK